MTDMAGEKKRVLRQGVFAKGGYKAAGSEAPDDVDDRFVEGTKEGRAAAKEEETRAGVGNLPPITSPAPDATGEASGDAATQNKGNVVGPGSAPNPGGEAKKEAKK